MCVRVPPVPDRCDDAVLDGGRLEHPPHEYEEAGPMTLLEAIAKIRSPTLRAVIVFLVVLYQFATGRFNFAPTEDEKAIMRWEDDGGR